MTTPSGSGIHYVCKYFLKQLMMTQIGATVDGESQSVLALLENNENIVSTATANALFMDVDIWFLLDAAPSSTIELNNQQQPLVPVISSANQRESRN